MVHAHPNLAEEAVYLSQASGDNTRRVGEPRHEAYIARRPLRRGFVPVLVTDDDGVRDDAGGVGSGGTLSAARATSPPRRAGEDAVPEAWRLRRGCRLAARRPARRTGSSSTCTTAGVRCVTPSSSCSSPRRATKRSGAWTSPPDARETRRTHNLYASSPPSPRDGNDRESQSHLSRARSPTRRRRARSYTISLDASMPSPQRPRGRHAPAPTPSSFIRPKKG